jgi:hemerythrin
MATLNWNDDFNINVGPIDEQHRQMLELALDLHQAAADGHATAEVVRKFDQLAEFTRTHFDFEESLMLEHDYPHLEDHRREHANLLDRLTLFRRGLENGRLLQLSPSVDIGQDWVLAHVAGADRQLGRFLNRQEIF